MSYLDARDPLLAGTKLILSLLLIVFAIGLIALAIVAVALPFPFVQAQIVDLHLAAGVSSWTFSGRLVVMLILVAAILASVFLILLLLRRIVDTVGAGDPFVPINAGRLRDMGVLMIVLTLSIPALPPVVAWLNVLLSEPAASDSFEFQPDGLLLALVLFILARVFKVGAAMRGDLEGTV